MAEKIRQYKGMGGVSSYLQRMWAKAAVCGLVAANVGSWQLLVKTGLKKLILATVYLESPKVAKNPNVGLFAVNVVLERALFADNLVPKWGVIAGL